MSSFAANHYRSFLLPVLPVRPAALCALVALLLAIPAFAQQPPEPRDSNSTADSGPSASSGDDIPSEIRAAADRIEYVGPDTYILLDKNGQPQPVPGMTYEDFVEAWKKEHAATGAQRTPRYVVESTQYVGESRNGYADVEFVAVIHLMTAEWVDVPLGLVGAVLQGKAEIQAQADAKANPAAPPNNPEQSAQVDQIANFVTHDPEQGGYVAHLKGQSGERLTIKLSLVVPITRDGTQSTLQLGCPKAVASKLTITTRLPVADVNISAGTLLAQVPAEQGGTRLEVAGPAGDFRLAWRSAEENATEMATVLSAATAMHVYVDGRSVRNTTRLTVQSYGGGFDRFRVQLPPGAQLVTPPNETSDIARPSYRISAEDGAKRTGNEDPTRGGRTILVQFPAKQLAPAVVELVTEQPIGLNQSSSVELGGFAVIGAVRQFGDVAVEVADDWQARWEVGANVRQVDSTDLVADLQKSTMSACFQYDRQPWSLAVKIAARKTRVHVVPQYEELQCLPDEARLSLRLNYQVFGRRAFEFRVRMEGWELVGDPIDPGGLIDKEKVHPTADGTLILPLKKASTPRADVLLIMRRQLRRDDSRVKIPLPVPIAESIGTGELTAKASSDIELMPDLANSIGLTPIAISEATETPSSRGTLRFRTVQPEVVFVAERIAKDQEVSAGVECEIDLNESQANVTEKITYNVRYVALEDLVFEMPGDVLLGEDQLEVALIATPDPNADEQSTSEIPLAVTHTPEDFETSTLGDASRFRVTLPQPRLGQFAIQLRYRIPKQGKGGASAAWRLPLIQPVELNGVELSARIRPARGLIVSLDSKAVGTTWRAVGTPSNVSSSQTSLREYFAEGAEDVIPLIVAETDFESPSATSIDRIWIQTWFSGNLRQDRAAIRFRSAGSQVTVELPPQTNATDFEVLIDGKPADVISRTSGRIVVRLRRKPNDDTSPESVAIVEHTLELRSREHIRYGLLTRHRITPPLLVGGTTLTNVYWQIVLPGDEHIVRSPARMSSANQWQWLGNYFLQRPAMDQASLEQWAGAIEQEPPAASQNQYLYAGLAPVVSIELVTAPRWLIVLAASATALALGLVWQYVPAVRHRWILPVIACVLAGLTAAFPAPALLLAQASALGVIIALLAFLLKRVLTRPSPWPVITTSGSSLRQAPPRTDSILLPPLAAASTAPTVSLRTTDPE